MVALSSFARTKIQPPCPRGVALVERTALQARLAEVLATRRLVLVSAAAGCGKTTLLAHHFAGQHAPGPHPACPALAWIAADEGDDLPRLLECLLAALEPHGLRWRTPPGALPALAAGARGPRRAADALLNALEACAAERGTIVVDDAHRIGDGAFFAFLDLLLERLPPRWTLVLATRRDPPLALARLRAAGELAEFRQADLMFDRGQAHQLAFAAGLDAAAADALFERTEGWPAGLRLALAGARAAAPGAGERAILDFLGAEVIDPLDPPLRDFLLRSAVLPEISASSAAALTGCADAGRRIEQVERLGLFATALDAPEPTIRLHAPFRRALLRRSGSEPGIAWPPPWQRAAVPAAPSRGATGAGDRRCGLSTRELEVLARIAAGDSNKLIARGLGLSPHTVKRHVANILGKLALGSRGQAAAWWRARDGAAPSAGYLTRPSFHAVSSVS